MDSLLLRVTRAQHDIIKCPARFMGLFAGRRWGKTFAWRYRHLALTAAGPVRLAYIVPSYAQLRPEYETLLFHPAVRELLSDRGCGLQPFPHLSFITGGQLQLRSFDRPGNVRSQGLDEVWVDEIQDIKASHFWPVIRPLISDRRGKLVVSGQFRGKNWYYDQFYAPGQPGKESKRPLYWSWRFPSSTGPAYQGEAGRKELEIARSQVPAAVWDQEYECLPSANLNKVFRCVERCRGGTPHAARQPRASYITAWDSGKVADPSAVVTVEALSGLVVDARLIPLGTEFTQQLEIVAGIAAKYNSHVVMDITGAGTQDRLLDFARAKIKRINGIIFSRREKEQMVNQLAVWLEQSKLQIPTCFTELLRQLEEYEYEYIGSRIEYRAPPGDHDDLVAALAMAVSAIEQNMHANPYGRPLHKMVG